MANFNCNKIFLGGRLTADPELKQTASGIAVCTFSIAVRRRYGGKEGEQPPADFFNVTAWRERAEFVRKYFRKGSSIFVVGTVQNRSRTDDRGVKRSATDVLADEVTFVDSRAESPGEGTSASEATYVPDAYTATPEGQPNFEDVKADEDLPF